MFGDVRWDMFVIFWMQCFVFLRDVRKNCECCYLWYENSMRWPPPLCCSSFTLKSPCSEMLAFSRMLMHLFPFEGYDTEEVRSRVFPHNVEPQVHRAENRLCRIWCLHGWACEQPSWPFSVFIPQSHQRSLSQSEGGEFAGQRYHFKGEVAEGRGKAMTSARCWAYLTVEMRCDFPVRGKQLRRTRKWPVLKQALMSSNLIVGGNCVVGVIGEGSEHWTEKGNINCCKYKVWGHIIRFPLFAFSTY